MIQSILDNDLYKFTMQQAVHSLYPRAEARYEFINRGKTPFPENFADELLKKIDHMATLKLYPDELRYLQETCYFLTPVYLDFLTHFRFDPKNVAIEQTNGIIKLKICGPKPSPEKKQNAEMLKKVKN